VLRLSGAHLDTRATAVLVTTVPLEASPVVSAGFSRSRLVCCGTGSPLVFEVDLPPGITSALAVAAEPATAAPPADAVEVYSSSSASWRPLPGALGLPGSAALEAGDIEGGVVRLRARDRSAVKTMRVVSLPAG